MGGPAKGWLPLEVPLMIKGGGLLIPDPNSPNAGAESSRCPPPRHHFTGAEAVQSPPVEAAAAALPGLALQGCRQGCASPARWCCQPGAGPETSCRPNGSGSHCRAEPPSLQPWRNRCKRWPASPRTMQVALLRREGGKGTAEGGQLLFSITVERAGTWYQGALCWPELEQAALQSLWLFSLPRHLCAKESLSGESPCSTPWVAKDLPPPEGLESHRWPEGATVPGQEARGG